METSRLRQLFLDFFRSKEHHIEPSASLVPPADDKSLLLINAGMAPLKPYFLGLSKPPSTRIASVQRCLRTNDIDEVGRTPRHLTLFEMLGNFSFGDYFKREIILWSWEFVREWLEIPEDKLCVSVFENDDEAFGIWEKEVGVKPDRIYRLGEDDNFWYMADTGPCGPDSEIFYDIGEELGPDETPATGGDRWVEIWNLVFTQFDRQEDGTLKSLPKKNVDTGMGLERTAMALQGKSSVFEADCFKPIFEVYRGDTPPEILDTKSYIKAGVNSLYVVADHVRAVAMLIADGVYPGNEGRGYVLRRILRRALVHLRRLGQPGGGILKAFPVILDQLGETYPNLIERREHIEKLVNVEEENFLRTLEAGITRLESAIDANNAETLSGEIAFEMFDTYGVPLDVTIEMAQARGMEVDVKGYENALENARQRSRVVTEDLLGADQESKYAVKTTDKTEFIGYEVLAETAVVAEYNREHDFLVLDRTPFYGEKGGQVGDHGMLKFDGGEIAIADTQHVGEVTVHKIDRERCTGDLTMLKPGDRVTAMVDCDRRRGIRRAHTATHLLHAALRSVLGDHVQQAGSVVEPDRLRFDFSHFQPLTREEIRKVEDWSNQRVFDEHDVHTSEVPYEEAIKAGAMALFGEKYEENVRMVWVGGADTGPEPGDAETTELCGGTHVSNTGVIGLIRIIHEESVASGVRRIEAITGKRSYEHAQEADGLLHDLSETLNFPIEHLDRGAVKISEQVRHLEKEKKDLEQRLASGATGVELEEIEIGDLKAIVFPVQKLSPDAVSKILDKQASDGKVVAFAVTDYDGKGSVLVRCSDDAVVSGIKAGDIVKTIAPAMDGRGGGKPTFARGGVDASKYDDGRAAFLKALES